MMGNATKGYVDERLKEVSGGVTQEEFNDLSEYVHDDVVAAINNNTQSISSQGLLLSQHIEHFNELDQLVETLQEVDNVIDEKVESNITHLENVDTDLSNLNQHFNDNVLNTDTIYNGTFSRYFYNSTDGSRVQSGADNNFSNDTLIDVIPNSIITIETPNAFIGYGCAGFDANNNYIPMYEFTTLTANKFTVNIPSNVVKVGINVIPITSDTYMSFKLYTNSIDILSTTLDNLIKVVKIGNVPDTHGAVIYPLPYGYTFDNCMIVCTKITRLDGYAYMDYSVMGTTYLVRESNCIEFVPTDGGVRYCAGGDVHVALFKYSN